MAPFGRPHDLRDMVSFPKRCNSASRRPATVATAALRDGNTDPHPAKHLLGCAFTPVVSTLCEGRTATWSNPCAVRLSAPFRCEHRKLPGMSSGSGVTIMVLGIALLCCVGGYWISRPVVAAVRMILPWL